MLKSRNKVALKKFEAVVFIGVLAFCLSPTAQAHEFNYSVSIQCDKNTLSARVGADNGDQTLHVPAYQHDFDSLPKVACDFGANKRVILSTVRSGEHPNADRTSISINKPTKYVGFSIWMQFGGYILVSFDHGNGVHIKNCEKHPGDTENAPCEEFDYKTTYSITSTNSPSFDCKKANTVEETLICDDPALSSADSELSKIYHQKLAENSNDGVKITTYQKAWGQFRGAGCFLNSNHDLFPADSTKAKECLLVSYQKRINQLKVHPDRPPLSED